MLGEEDFDKLSITMKLVRRSLLEDSENVLSAQDAVAFTIPNLNFAEMQ